MLAAAAAQHRDNVPEGQGQFSEVQQANSKTFGFLLMLVLMLMLVLWQLHSIALLYRGNEAKFLKRSTTAPNTEQSAD